YRPTASANVQSNYSQNGSGWNNPAATATTASNVNVPADIRRPGPGTLNRSYLTTTAGSRVWALGPDDPPQHRTRVTAGPSINPEDYVHHHVDIQGTLSYDGATRVYYLIPSRVEMLSR